MADLTFAELQRKMQLEKKKKEMSSTHLEMQRTSIQFLKS